MSKIFGLVALLFLTEPAQAYIGPGMAAGTVAAVLGFFAAIFLGLFAIVWYPLKRRLRRRAEQPTAESKEAAPPHPDK